MTKTNAMRMLDKAKIPYEALEYTVDESDLSGVTIAKAVGLDCSMVFKTLVAKGDKTGPIVMCIPVDKEIDLKKAASLSGNKKIEMIHVKDLLSLTGYIRGGCSPVGMKKKFPTYFNDSCQAHEKITVSAGVKGCQLLVCVKELIEYTSATVCDLIKKEE
ncbi:MAG: Cys-tRNA(Pro) deacylase [Clostridia bacterium]|nr:Cys-tRNA(Pro) deacylase [Clostridia bacterium]